MLVGGITIAWDIEVVVATLAALHCLGVVIGGATLAALLCWGVVVAAAVRPEWVACIRCCTVAILCCWVAAAVVSC